MSVPFVAISLGKRSPIASRLLHSLGKMYGYRKCITSRFSPCMRTADGLLFFGCKFLTPNSYSRSAFITLYSLCHSQRVVLVSLILAWLAFSTCAFWSWFSTLSSQPSYPLHTYLLAISPAVISTSSLMFHRPSPFNHSTSLI